MLFKKPKKSRSQSLAETNNLSNRTVGWQLLAGVPFVVDYLEPELFSAKIYTLAASRVDEVLALVRKHLVSSKTFRLGAQPRCTTTSSAAGNTGTKPTSSSGFVFCTFRGGAKLTFMQEEKHRLCLCACSWYCIAIEICFAVHRCDPAGEPWKERET